uniref:Uncharacterized protein n=1 Tax=Aegilops tauschii TaxID=37682 RepID=M8CNM8_AEGTA
MCDEAGLDICISEHGDEVRVGSVDVLDKDQVDASKHMVGNVDDGRVDEKTEEEGLILPVDFVFQLVSLSLTLTFSFLVVRYYIYLIDPLRK